MKAEEGQEANMLQVAGVVTILEILAEEDIITNIEEITNPEILYPLLTLVS